VGGTLKLQTFGMEKVSQSSELGCAVTPKLKQKNRNRNIADFAAFVVFIIIATNHKPSLIVSQIRQISP
jgi:hypothetical protein